MPNIDFIYMINLDQRPEKWAHSIHQLIPYDILPYRFSAINGWEDLTVEIINDVGLKFSMNGRGFHGDKLPHFKNRATSRFITSDRPILCTALPEEPIGCFLSHLSVLQDAYDRGFETIWVMEDDIEVCAIRMNFPFSSTRLIMKWKRELGRALYRQRMKRGDGAYIPCWSACRRPDITQCTLVNDFAIREVSAPFIALDYAMERIR